MIFIYDVFHRFFQKSKTGHEPGTDPTNQHRSLGIQSSIQKTRFSMIKTEKQMIFFHDFFLFFIGFYGK